MNNFEILNYEYPDLAKLCTYAESYVYSDPVSSIIKLRTFCEEVVNIIYRCQRFYYEDRWTYFDCLESTEFKNNIDESVLKKFHAIRIKGNSAVHKSLGSSEDALWLLREAYALACWFNALYSKSESTPCKEFVKPIDHGIKIDKLKETIKELEDAVFKEKEKNRLVSLNHSISDKESTSNFKAANEQIAIQMNFSDEEINKRIDIEEIYSEYSLTDEQKKLVQKLKQFLSSKDQNLFLLKGYAGTGKTFILKGLTDYFELIGRSYRLSAPTGKAARVISEKTKKQAYTIHKTIYSNKDIKEYKTANTDGSETYKFYYDLNVNEDSATTVYIIDEASMVSDIYSEGEFFRFGSGLLLKDLLKYVNLDNNDHDKKIIFIGDNAQLPPIGMSFSPALDEKYLRDKHLLQVTSYELTEVVRQSKGSGILQNAIEIRTALKDVVFNKLDINTSFEDIEHIEHQELMDKYLKSCDSKINAESIIIAHSNVSVSEYNRRVREYFFPNQPLLAPGDKIMSLINMAFTDFMLANGDFLLVKEVASESEKRQVRLRRRDENSEKILEIDISLVFRDVVLGFKDSEDNTHFFHCKIIENLLYSDKANLSSDEHKALYVDFLIRHKHLKAGTKEFKDTLRMDPYFNPMRVKFGYAITCHKAQGSEWNHVFVNCQHSNNTLNSDYFRWLYTAITRASKNLYLLDEPHVKPTSSMTRAGGVFEELISNTSNLTISTSRVDNATARECFGIEPGNSFLLTLLNSVSNAIVSDCIDIVDIQHKQYQEAYFFSDGKDRARINIYYNAKQEISNISWQEKSVLSDKLVGLLASLHHQKISLKPVYYQETNEKCFEFTEPFLEEFYMQLKSILKDHNINIDDISSHQWLEKYMFSRNDEIASFDFYYNGKKQFTRFMEQKKNSTSVSLIRDLNKILSSELG